jgi:hypothetical protein
MGECRRDAVLTPDSRYIVVEGKAGPRLWRASNPRLGADERDQLVKTLMEARSAVRGATGEALARARSRVDDAKRALGERGPVWWQDGAPDLNRRLVRNSPYREWWEKRCLTDQASAS